MKTERLLMELQALVDNNKRTIEYGDEVVDVGFLYNFIEEHLS